MRYLVLAAMTAAAVAMAGGSAEAAKKTHRSYQAYPPGPAYAQPGPVWGNPDLSGGNAAAGGNNANSMSGSNSAGNNAIGRTSGSGGRS